MQEILGSDGENSEEMPGRSCRGGPGGGLPVTLYGPRSCNACGKFHHVCEDQPARRGVAHNARPWLGGGGAGTKEETASFQLLKVLVHLSQGAIALSNVYGHPCFICSFCAFISRMCPLVSERPKRGDFGV